MANKQNGTLYIGVTNNLVRRGHEHRTAHAESFTKRYSLSKLIWFEQHDSIETAILREKELKKWRRQWKIDLIEQSNPHWSDLYPALAAGGG